MRLDIYSDGSVVVTVPPRKHKMSIDRYINRKKKWLMGRLNLMQGIDTKAIHSVSKKRYKEYKAEALSLARERVDHFNRNYNFSVKRISIRNQKTRWGSCSEDGVINLNYKIIFLPQRQRDYIIVHELCHLGELNHSYRFWNLVSESIPDYIEIKKSLKYI